MKTSEKIKNQLIHNNVRFWANDNVSNYISEEDREALIDETAEQFELVLQSLLIDTETDPNSAGTAKRLSKMYWKEIFSGRYFNQPDVTAFPNEGTDIYEGMITIRAEIKSICSHHHQPVLGTCYIGIIPNGKVLGLSKYIRIAQWHARRGTLQEELTSRIAKSIEKLTESSHVGVYIQATHGCVSCRGVMQENSLTQTTVLLGDFKKPDVKKEFIDNIKIQQHKEV